MFSQVIAVHLKTSLFCGSLAYFSIKVWKQKGEEYRVTGYGGWSWVSKTRVPRFVPKLPGNTNVNYRKELEGKG